jgi:RHS repeat-associated protein
MLAPGDAIYVHSNEPTDLEIPAREERIRYYHQDHLGSSSVMTDANGALVEETAFYPFGIPRHEHRLRQIEEAYKFTQKERDRESGLHYFEARFLAANLARFLNPDPRYLNTEAPLTDPQAINLYAYVRNAPTHLVDPTGLDPTWTDRQSMGLDDPNKPAPGSQYNLDWGRIGNVVGGAGEAAGGVGLCATLVGCVVGAPLIAHGSDKIATGIVGADETLTARYLGKDFDEGMDLIGFAAGGAALARGVQARLAERASENLVLNIPRQSTYKVPAYYDGPAPTPRTLPGPAGKPSPAAALVSKANQRAAAAHAHWNELINATPKDTWLHATIDATRSTRTSLPLREQPAALRSIYEAADALFQ